jgi:translocation and assembly module TamB
VKTLQGGGGFDPIEKARDVLNVDTIKVNTEETEEGQAVSLGAGKYISDKVYLELERSSDPANPWQGNVRIELAPHVSLESTTGGTTGGSAEILWKYDY